MSRAGSKRTKPKMTIMELPYQIHHGLSCIMDPAGGKDWKHLVSTIPNYTAKDVQRIEIEGSKPGASCTRQLLKDMENRGYDVEDLEKIIKMSGNENAFKCLRNGLESKSMSRDKYSKSDYHDHECIKRWEGHHERAENEQTYIAGTRETLRMGSPIQQPRNEIMLDNSLPGTRETLLNNAIHLQSQSKIGLQNLDPGTRKTSMNKVIHRQRCLKITQQNKGPGTRGTLTVDNPTQQQTGTMCLNIPVQETKGLTQVLHDTNKEDENFATENDENLYQGTTGQQREIKKIMESTTNEKRASCEGDDTMEDNLQQILSKNCFSFTTLPCSFFAWMMSCGSQTGAM